jgi:hypothetical protein
LYPLAVLISEPKKVRQYPTGADAENIFIASTQEQCAEWRKHFMQPVFELPTIYAFDMVCKSSVQIIQIGFTVVKN